MQRVDTEHPFGKVGSPVIVIGGIGSDHMATNMYSLDGLVKPGRKHGVANIDVFNGIISRYGISLGEPYSGFTAGNVAMSVAKKNSEAGVVHSFVTLAPRHEDPTSSVIQKNLENEGIVVHVTEDPGIPNSRSAVLPPYNERRIVTFKDARARAVRMIPNGLRPGLTVFSNAAGEWAQSWNTGVEFTEATESPSILVVASESQISQLPKDKTKRDAYKKVLSKAVGFAGNVDEAKMLVDIYGLGGGDTDDPLQLARLLQGFGEQKKYAVTLTNGKEGGTTVDWFDNHIEHHVPEGPASYGVLFDITDGPLFGHVENSLGAGDEHAGAFAEGTRLHGADLPGLVQTINLAGVGSTRVVGQSDAQIAQLRYSEFSGQILHPGIPLIVNDSYKWV